MVTSSPCCLRICRVLPRADLTWGQADVAGSDGGSLQTSTTQIRDQLQAAEVLRPERERPVFHCDMMAQLLCDNFDECY